MALWSQKEKREAGKEKMKYIMLITGTRSNSVWKHSGAI